MLLGDGWVCGGDEDFARLEDSCRWLNQARARLDEVVSHIVQALALDVDKQVGGVVVESRALLDSLWFQNSCKCLWQASFEFHAKQVLFDDRECL